MIETDSQNDAEQGAQFSEPLTTSTTIPTQEIAELNQSTVAVSSVNKSENETGKELLSKLIVGGFHFFTYLTFFALVFYGDINSVVTVVVIFQMIGLIFLVMFAGTFVFFKKIVEAFGKNNNSNSLKNKQTLISSEIPKMSALEILRKGNYNLAVIISTHFLLLGSGFIQLISTNKAGFFISLLLTFVYLNKLNHAHIRLAFKNATTNINDIIDQHDILYPVVRMIYVFFVIKFSIDIFSKYSFGNLILLIYMISSLLGVIASAKVFLKNTNQFLNNKMTANWGEA